MPAEKTSSSVDISLVAGAGRPFAFLGGRDRFLSTGWLAVRLRLVLGGTTLAPSCCFTDGVRADLDLDLEGVSSSCLGRLMIPRGRVSTALSDPI